MKKFGLGLLLLWGCADDSSSVDAATTGGQAAPSPQIAIEPPKEVEVERPAEWSRQAQALQLTIDEQSPNDVAELLLRFDAPHEELGFKPGEAENLELIQLSSVSLNDEELAMLDDNGFVMSGGQTFPSFAYGYRTLYMNDLPLFVSADSLLDAVHRSYDLILKTVESDLLIAELGRLLDDLRAELDEHADHPAVVDADLYLAVASQLLTNSRPNVEYADAAEVDRLVALADKAEGREQIELFGARRQLDFSQFTPRGHYTDSTRLERYFRAMIWLGRVDFRLIETLGSGEQVFHRRQYEAMLLIRQLFDAESLARFAGIDRAIQLFTGESDYMTLPEVVNLTDDLGGATQALSASDNVVAQTILDGGYGEQRIASHIIFKSPEAPETLPLNRSFLIFGQRYALDSHVFSNVVWDRVEKKRMLPNPLDVAFAALRNDHAAELMAGELEQFQYHAELGKVRTLADEHEPAFWEKNLYNMWLSALRALSPVEEELPSVAQTEPWNRRILNTQLASWAQLRRDAILYVKQSYSTGDACEFPDAYVDPYPEFYAALRLFAERGMKLALIAADAGANQLSLRLSEYFTGLDQAMATLGEMAEYQRTGTPFTDEHLAFINRIVSVDSLGCGGPPLLTEGWYADLFFDPTESAEYDPVIADVHTQPTDAGGAEVGRVLHVGTDGPRLMVVVVDTCNGPRAYAGLASSYFEVVTENYERLNDEDWTEMRQQSAPTRDVPWLEGLISPQN